MSPTLRRIRWRLIWTSVIALVLSLGSFYLNQWVFSFSDDQCTWVRETYRGPESGKKVVRKRVLIREILPEGVAEEAGLLEGDELLIIQGKKVNPDRLVEETQAFVNEQAEGRILIYVVRRYDYGKKEYRILQLPVRVTKPFHLTPLIVLLSGLITWALGLLVVVSSPQRKTSRHFYYLGLMALLLPLAVRGFTGNVPVYIQVPTLFVSQLVLALAPPLWLHFFLRFPHAFPLRINRTFLTGLYGSFLCLGLLVFIRQMAAVLFGASLIGELIRTSPIGWFFPLLNTLFYWAITSTLVTGMVLFWVGAFKLEERRRWALLSALIFSSAILLDLLAYSLLAARAGDSLMFQRESWIFFAPLPLLPISFAYAILRHGFFDVQRALIRWATYFAVLGITLVAYLAALAWLFAQGVQVVPVGWIGALVGLSALPIGWLLRWLLLTLRRTFRRDLNQARELILGSLRETRKRLAEDVLLAGLKESLREAFRPQLLLVLPVEAHSILLPSIQAPDGEEGLMRGRQLELPPQLLRHARENLELVLGLGGDESDWIREQAPELRAHVDALGAQVLVLLMANQEPHTVILLGGKYAELNYGREDRELLREVAQIAGTIIETTILHRRLLDQGRLELELQTARRIQESLITFDAPSIEGYQLALRLEPALETGGDLLWVKRRSSGKWIAAVGDVSGKGLAAALYMSQAMALLKFATQSEKLSFDQILPALDKTLRNLMGRRDFLTLALLEWDDSGRYRIARAGHPPALVLRGPRREDIQELNCVGRGLGLRPSSDGAWEIQEGTLRPGEWIVMYSDGLTEAMNQVGELYGLQRLEEQLLRMRATGSARAACEAVYQDVAAFERQNRDDRTLFILGRDGL